MTELTFLVELLLNHKLQKPTRDAIATRLKEVEEAIASLPPQAHHRPMPQLPGMNGQSPSMQAIMARNPDLVPAVAQTPAAAAALTARQEAVSISLSGKPEKGRTSPRKF